MRLDIANPLQSLKQQVGHKFGAARAELGVPVCDDQDTQRQRPVLPKATLRK